MSRLLERVAWRRRDAGVPFALIGAGAMAAHGVSRATADLDLLAIDPVFVDPPGPTSTSSWAGEGGRQASSHGPSRHRSGTVPSRS